MNTRNDMPQCQCPECDNEWQKDDHYLIETDDTIFCPSCGAELLVERIEILITNTITGKIEDRRQRRQRRYERVKP